MRAFWQKHSAKILGALILAIFALVIISVIALLGGAVMRVFGFEYESIGSIIWFFLLATVVSLPASLLAEGLPRALMRAVALSKPAAIALYIAMDTIATAIGLSIVDYFIKSVSAENTAVFVVSLLLALWSARDFDGKPEGST